MYDPDTTTQEQVARERIAGWWSLLGVTDPQYPTDTATVCRLLQAVEYIVTPDDVLAYVSGGIIPPVPGDGGRHEWNATNIVALAAALELRRRWHPFSRLHGHKMTAVEKVKAICEHRGESAFEDLAQFDLEGLLGMLVQVSHDAGAVQCLAAALREKLAQEAVL